MEIESTRGPLRAHLIQALHAELVGPYDLDANAAEELLSLSPSRRYLTGFLSPPQIEADGHNAVVSAEVEAQAVDEDDNFEAGSDKQTDDSATPDPEPATRKVFPASVGISVLLPAEAKQVTARLRWGEYRREIPEPEDGGKTKGPPVWRRGRCGPTWASPTRPAWRRSRSRGSPKRSSSRSRREQTHQWL